MKAALVFAEFIAPDGTPHRHSMAVSAETMAASDAALTWAYRMVTMELVARLREEKVPLQIGASIGIWSVVVEE